MSLTSNERKRAVERNSMVMDLYRLEHLETYLTQELEKVQGRTRVVRRLLEEYDEGEQ